MMINDEIIGWEHHIYLPLTVQTLTKEYNRFCRLLNKSKLPKACMHTCIRTFECRRAVQACDVHLVLAAVGDGADVLLQRHARPLGGSMEVMVV